MQNFQYGKDFSVTRLRGGWAMTFKSAQGTKSRHQLEAKDRDSAIVEAQQRYSILYQATLAAKGMNITEIWTRYSAYLHGRPTAERMRGEEQFILGHFGLLSPKDITEDIVKHYIANRRHARTGKAVSDGTLWTELGHLRDAINYAAKNRWISRDDVPYIKRPQKPDPKWRYLTAEEEERLLKATKGHVYLATVIMLCTGARIGAVLELKWDQVDFVKGTIDLKSGDMKYRKGRAEVAMGPKFMDLLKQQYAVRQGDWLIMHNYKSVKSISQAFARAVKNAGLNDVSPHVLRHTAAMKMRTRGVPIPRISAVLGHSDISVTQKVYAKLGGVHLKKEAQILDVLGNNGEVVCGGNEASDETLVSE